MCHRSIGHPAIMTVSISNNYHEKAHERVLLKIDNEGWEN